MARKAVTTFGDPCAGLRIGCVSYLNARPLIAAADLPVERAHPSELAAKLDAGTLDVALVPAFHALSHPECAVVDGIAIGCCGAVGSVFLAYRGPLEAVSRIELDSASISSANLLDALLRAFRGLSPEYGPGEGAAKLLIGDQAIAFRRREGDAWDYLDLGEDWLRWTGLPFVFGLWAIRPGVPRQIGDRLRAWKAAGMALRERIAAGEPEPRAALEYLTKRIRYDLGDGEKRGLRRFAEVLANMGKLSGDTELRFL